MKLKFFVLLLPLSLLAASCDLVTGQSAGLLKTANGGVDWQEVSRIKDSKTTLAKDSIAKIIFGPNGADVLYAASLKGGFYISKDGGESWEELLGKIPVTDFAVNPLDSNVLYVAGMFAERGTVLSTKDGGKSWNEIYSAAEKGTAVRTIGINPINPQQIAIGLTNGGLLRSEDAGSAWKMIQTYSDRVSQIIWRADGMFVLARSQGLFRSTDGGTSFTEITKNIVAPENGNSFFSNTIESFYQISVANGNSQLIYLSTNLGLFRTKDGGNLWSFVSMPLRQKEIPPYAVAISPSSSGVVYVGAGTNIYKSLDSGNTWLVSDTGRSSPVNTIAIHPFLPQVAFAGIYKQ